MDFLIGIDGVWLAVVLSVASLIYAFTLNGWIKKQSAGTELMQELAAAVQQGAMAFLKTEYRILAIFAVAVAVALNFGV
ncbi:MAG TPA: sodium-translocating pyrophosphatase, partial [Planctomycetes bacterium]|nr:sodium-translocating pyrophosphatase [Planctomycetota bacterium]